MSNQEKLIIEKVLIYGQSYTPAVLPKYLHQHRGEVGDCYDASILCAFRNAETVKYVEGIAKNPLTGEWLLHSWVTDGENAFDLTWKATKKDVGEIPFPAEYIGISMETRLVINFLRATGYKSVLINGWRDVESAGKILPSDLIIK